MSVAARANAWTARAAASVVVLVSVAVLGSAMTLAALSEVTDVSAVVRVNARTARTAESLVRLVSAVALG